MFLFSKRTPYIHAMGKQIAPSHLHEDSAFHLSSIEKREELVYMPSSKPLALLKYTLLFLIFLNPAFLQAQETKEMIPFYPGQSFQIILKNEPMSGQWKWEEASEHPAVTLESKREANLNTYFVFQVSEAQEEELQFIYEIDGQIQSKRIFVLQPQKEMLTQESATMPYFGDIPESEQKSRIDLLSNIDEGVKGNLLSLEPKDTTESQDLSSPTPLPSQSFEATSPRETEVSNQEKLFLKSLIQQNLLEEAYQTIEDWKNQGKIANGIEMELMQMSILYKQKKWQELIPQVEKLLKSENNREMSTQDILKLHTYKARALEEEGNPSGAVKELLWMKYTFPEQEEVYYNLAKYYLRHQNLHLARENLMHLLQNTRVNDAYAGEIYYLLGNYYYSLGIHGYKEAYEYYQKIEDLDESPYQKKIAKRKQFIQDHFLSFVSADDK